jgi:hypothetical protein
VPTLSGNFASVDDTYATFELGIVGDTTRYQSFGPFQGKRFNASIRYWPQISGDSVGDIMEYRLDYRGYKKVTRRSTLAWRLRGIYNDGDSEVVYGAGGLNELRGWDYRLFSGSRILQTNLEFRFPLAEELRFPILSIQQIRGFFFLDALAPFFLDNLFYDPELGGFRVDPMTGPIRFKFWDSDESRLQDGRASYGMGFQFRFVGGLQFNWAFVTRMKYTQFVPDLLTGSLVKTEAGDEHRSEFYIVFDW